MGGREGRRERGRLGEEVDRKGREGEAERQIGREKEQR